MGSGKTTALQGVLLKNKILLERKTLIICTEEGDTEYDEVLSGHENVDIICVEDEKDFTSEYLLEVASKYEAESVYIEFNGTWDLRRCVRGIIPKTWEVAGVFSFVDAQTYDMYLKNMRQIIMNPLSVSDVILFNRCPETMKKGDVRRALKILNGRAEVHFARMDGTLDFGFDELLLSDEDGVIRIDDQLFCPWFVDCIENSDKYYDKKIQITVMVTRGEGLAKNQFYAGRMTAICCAEDAQFIGFVAQCKGDAPENGTWLNATATIKKGTIDHKKAIILLDIESAEVLPAPEDIYLYF